MNAVIGLLKNRAFYAVVFSVVISLAFVSYIATAATTISTNVNTGGTLTVSGVSTLTDQVFASSTVIATGRMQTYGQLVLQSATSDPTAFGEGALYYDSTNRVVKLYNGTSWFSVASSTDASGGLILTDNVGVRFNTIATGYMVLGTTTLPVATTTLSSSALVLLNSTTTATVPLQIVGVIDQTGSLLRAYQTTAAAGHRQVFAITTGGASTTALSTTRRAIDAFVVSGYATTSGATGNFATEGTLAVLSTSAFTGDATFAGAVTLGDALADAIIITGAASTTNSLNVGTVFSVRGMATTTASIADGVATTTLGSFSGNVLGIGTTTPAGAKASALGVDGNVYINNTGTTTLHLKTTTAATGSCIEMTGEDGNIYRLYISAGLATTSPGTCHAGTN